MDSHPRRFAEGWGGLRTPHALEYVMKGNKYRILSFVGFGIVGFFASIILTSAAYASRIEMGTDYALQGEIEWFTAKGVVQAGVVQQGSTFQFHDNGIFSLDIVLDRVGTIRVDLGYDIADFEAGGEVRLRPAYEQQVNAITNHLNTSTVYAPEFDTDMDGTVAPIDSLYHINDLNAGVTSTVWKQIGLFDTQHLSLPEFVFIAANKDAVFNLDTFALTIWNGQFSPKGVMYDEVEWNLSTSMPIPTDVPEPASALLLASGLLGVLVRNKQRKAA